MDEEKKSAFLEKWANHKDLISYVWAKSRFIPHDVLLERIERGINAFMSMGVPFLLFKRSAVNSSNWLSSVFYEKLNTPLTYTENRIMPEKDVYHVVIVDDAAYTGTSIVGNICEAIAPFHPDSYVHVHIILGFITSVAIDRIISTNINNGDEKICVHLYAAEKIPTVRELVKEDGFAMDWDVFHKINGSKSDVTNIWFPHKIAMNVSTIRGFLVDVVNKPEDRSGIEKSINFPFKMYPEY